MFRTIIEKIFRVGNVGLLNKIETLRRQMEIRSFTTVFTQLRTISNRLVKVHRTQKQWLDSQEDSILTRRERLALDYALKLPKRRVLNYAPVYQGDKMSKQNYEDTAKECVMYADKMIEASETPADDCG